MQRTIENVGDDPTNFVYMLKTFSIRNISSTNKFDKNTISGAREKAYRAIAGVRIKLSLAQLEI